ncbi:ATP-binding protein, partial [Streptomyces sp. MCAF7]
SLASGVRLAYLREDQGGAGTALASAALTGAGHGVLSVNLEALARDPNPTEAVRVVTREARLTASGLVCTPIDALTRDNPEVIRAVSDIPLPVVLVGRAPWDAAWSTHPPLLLHAPRVEPAARAALWSAAYEGERTRGRTTTHKPPPEGAAPDHKQPLKEIPPDLNITRLLSPFLLTPDQITRAAQGAAQSAMLDGGTLRPDHVRAGARAQNAAGLDRLARRIEPAVAWPDLVLPPDALAQLRELTARARHRDRVLGEW